MDIDPLDPAAALAAVEHGPVHQPVHGGVQIGIGADIAGVLAAQFKPGGGEGARRRLFDRRAPADRAGEVHEPERPRGDQRLGRGVIQHDVLEHIFGHARGMVGLGQTFAHGQRLGNPYDPETTMGPMANTRFAELVRGQIADAVAQGARALIDPALYPADDGGAYLAPQVLVDVTHDMRVMREESFGPVVGIMPVSGDDQAVALMNDCDYGLTVSVWTADADAAAELGARLETGTVFMNRCDYLDPALCWTGCKDTGRGAALSNLGYLAVTRPKSYHLKKVTK